ncbi:MAG: hypothetical protein Q9159_007424 [Coniocarpon cinnabarinum]
MERPTDAHKRSKSSFSFRSNKSDKSGENFQETTDEKHKAKFAVQTVRDPNKAIREQQPGERMAEANTLPAIRQAQYKDWRGDVITDADASNPTRPRLERPLDTIRSFEAAIDNEWKRKDTLTRTGAESGAGPRASQSMNDYNTPRNPNRYNDHYARRPGNPRFQSSPMAPHSNGYSYNNNSPTHGYSQSYDTVDTGNSYGTSSSEPWTNSTDPSSDNSSIDRQYGANGYKYDGYQDMYGSQNRRESPRHEAIQEEYGYDGYGYTQGQHHGPYTDPAAQRQPSQWGARSMNAPPGQSMAQPPPTHQPQRNAMPFGGQTSLAAPPPPPKPNTMQRRPQQLQQQQTSSGDGKRKSWLKRRFSKG